ncbi:Phosphate transport system regulatory protein PhoU [Fimbriiglobus ruber]|uniref:Phosphate-specific transport system accessory protein PhoU n=2 Tax=Fimbriiglobus ruber TaxID=1908690 RepID=A0A225E3M1_9BACT|nr:Phosphate transport system regulatory protein PhoU [Fimbriiglobus ruber]
MARDLDKLQRSILRMAGAVEEAIYQATRALQERSPSLARQVVEGDSQIDNLENEVQDECLKILALHQPVAVDLRRCCAVLLICTDLERMGDLAVGIAERAIVLSKLPQPAIPDRVARMTHGATRMVRMSLDAFVHQDAEAARAVIRMDDEVDEDNAIIITELIGGMKTTADQIEAGLSLFSAVRHIERIADHATNIAEDVIYLVEGELVRHHPEAITRV